MNTNIYKWPNTREKNIFRNILSLLDEDINVVTEESI